MALRALLFSHTNEKWLKSTSVQLRIRHIADSGRICIVSFRQAQEMDVVGEFEYALELRRKIVEETVQKVRLQARAPNGGNQRGWYAEMRCLQICEAYQDAHRFPEWVVASVMSTQEEDGRGIDVMVYTLDDPIPLQVKSSYAGKERFLMKPHYRHIPCVVVRKEDSDEEVFRQICEGIEFVWEQRQLARRAAE